MRTSPVLDALFPHVRGRVLAATFGRPDREWYVTELARALETQPSSLQRELEALSKAGILELRQDGRRVYVKADKSSPVFSDLRSLLEKTAGLIPVLRGELEALGESVRLAFVYGSIARSEETSESDVDLMVIGKAGLSDLIPALRNSERALGRPVNPTVYSTEEFQERARHRDHFLTTVLKGPKQFVKGGEHELADASVLALSADRRFATAYNAALQSGTITIACSGYRVSARAGHHAVTFEAVALVLGPESARFTDYFEACRRKRNTIDYQNSSVATVTEANELVSKAHEFHKFVEAWVAANHPTLAAS